MEYRINVFVLLDVFLHALVGLSMSPVKDVALFSGFNENWVVQACNILSGMQM